MSTIEPLDPGELVRQNERLRRENRTLQETIRALRAELEQLNRRQKRQAAPFSKEQAIAQPKRPGRKAGQGTFRQREAPLVEAGSQPVIVVPVETTTCTHCGGELIEEREEEVTVTDLPERPQAEVRQYRVTVSRCQKCGRRTRGHHPDLAPDQWGATAHRLGPRLLSAAHSLHYDQGVPVRKVPAILQDLTGVSVTQGALTQDALRQAAGGTGKAYDDLRKGMGKAASVHTDDTGWRIGGQPAYLMGFTTKESTVYQIR